MNATHIHLIVNHIAILGVVFSVLLLLIGVVFKSKPIRLVAYGFVVMAAIAGFITLRTGESAEENVEHMAGISETMIHEHEEMAENAMVFVYVLAVLSLAGLYAEVKNKSIARVASFIILALGLVSSGFMANTGLSGGKIRHTEISGGTSHVQQEKENISGED